MFFYESLGTCTIEAPYVRLQIPSFKM